jgi:hypothetical protein
MKGYITNHESSADSAGVRILFYRKDTVISLTNPALLFFLQLQRINQTTVLVSYYLLTKLKST